MQKLDFHPAANFFPLMKGKEFDDLVKSIKEDGLQNPILIYQDEIIDGRNRYRACKEAGVDPKFEEWNGKDENLVRTIIALNLHRRHLSESQRAMVAADIANLQCGEKKANAQIGAFTESEAAKLCNVGKRTVQKAKKVQRSATPEVVEAVKSGELSLESAANIAENPPEKQRHLLSLPKVERTKETAKTKSVARVEISNDQKPAEQTGKPDEIVKPDNSSVPGKSFFDEFETRISILCNMINKARVAGWADLPEQMVLNQIAKVIAAFKGKRKPAVTKDKAVTEKSAEIAIPDATIEGLQTIRAEQQAEEVAADRSEQCPQCFGKLFDAHEKECQKCGKTNKCRESQALAS
jgi:ParB-like chromosome segregation protein Spo0J